MVKPPLWKIWKSVGMIIPNIWENKKWQPNHQPDGLVGDLHLWGLSTRPINRLVDGNIGTTASGKKNLVWTVPGVIPNMIIPPKRNSLVEWNLGRFLLFHVSFFGRVRMMPRILFAWDFRARSRREIWFSQTTLLWFTMFLPMNIPFPIGSMYGIYANIGGILMVNGKPYMAYIRILWVRIP